MRRGILSVVFCILLTACQTVADSVTEPTQIAPLVSQEAVSDDSENAPLALPDWLKDSQREVLVFIRASWGSRENASIVFADAITGEMFELPQMDPEVRGFFWMPDGLGFGLAVGIAKEAQMLIVDLQTGRMVSVQFVGQTDGNPWSSFGIARYFAIGDDPAAEDFQLLSQDIKTPSSQYLVEQVADELGGQSSLVVRGNGTEREYSGLPDFPITWFGDLAPDDMRMSVTQYSRPLDLDDYFAEKPLNVAFQVTVYRLEDGGIENQFPGWITSRFSPDGRSLVSKRWADNIDQSLPCIYSFETTEKTCIASQVLLPHLSANARPSFRSFSWLDDSSGLIFVYEIPAEDSWIRVGGLCSFKLDSGESLCWLEDLPQPVHVHFFEFSPSSNYLWFYASESCFACDYTAPATLGILEVDSGEYRLFTTEEMMVTTYSMHWRPAISD